MTSPGCLSRSDALALPHQHHVTIIIILKCMFSKVQQWRIACSVCFYIGTLVCMYAYRVHIQIKCFQMISRTCRSAVFHLSSGIVHRIDILNVYRLPRILKTSLSVDKYNTNFCWLFFKKRRLPFDWGNWWWWRLVDWLNSYLNGGGGASTSSWYFECIVWFSICYTREGWVQVQVAGMGEGYRKKEKSKKK